MVSRRKRLIALLLGLSLLALLTGCGQSQPGKGESSQKSDAVSLTYLEGQIITTADPAQHTDESSMIAVVNLYDPLLYPKDQEGSMAPGPSVADSWTPSPDGKTYTFQLHQGIKFHDATELTADDVVFSMQRMLALKKGFSWLWSGVLKPENVQAKDKYTVVFQLDKPYAPFLSTLEQLFVVNKKLVTANKQAGNFGDNGDYGVAYLERHDAGSGPYTMGSFSKDSELVLNKFKDYWRGWKPGQVDVVHYKVVKEEATQKTVLLSNQADMIDQWHSAEFYADLKSKPGIAVQESPSVQLFQVSLNTQKAPLDDIHFRQAVTYAFDYDAAAQSIFGGAAVAQGPVPIKTLWHNDAISAYQRDLDKARQELAQSKYKPGQYKLDYLYITTNEQERQTGLLLQQNLKDLGIEVNLIGQPWAQITQAAAKLETTPHMVAVFDTLKYPHPDSHTFGIYHSSAKGSYRATAWLQNTDIDKILEQARQATDPKDQESLYKEAQQKIVDQFPNLFIVNPTHRIAMHDYVKGYRYVGLLGYDVNFYDFSIQK